MAAVAARSFAIADLCNLGICGDGKTQVSMKQEMEIDSLEFYAHEPTRTKLWPAKVYSDERRGPKEHDVFRAKAHIFA